MESTGVCEDGMEIRYVTAFLAIAEELHFGRAAARLHLAQPSLSQQLQRLERELGVKLVARNSREVRLTHAGQAFEPEARALVAQLDRATGAARKAAAGHRGRITVGFNFLAGQCVLAPVLAEMQARYPEVDVVLTERRTGPQLAALEAGEIDIALVYGSPDTDKCGWRRLLRVPMVAIVGQNHRWAQLPRIAFGELAHEPCVLFEREQCPAMYDTLFSSANQSGIKLNVVTKVDDPGATSLTVSVKPVVGFASAPTGRFVGATGSLRPVPVPLCDPVPAVDLSAVWRSGDDSPKVGAFLECLEAAGPFMAG